MRLVTSQVDNGIGDDIESFTGLGLHDQGFNLADILYKPGTAVERAIDKFNIAIGC